MEVIIILLVLILFGFFVNYILKFREEQKDEFNENRYNYFRGHLK